MNRPPANESPASIETTSGWHCLHIYYEFDRSQLQSLPTSLRDEGCEHFQKILDPEAEGSPKRLQLGAVSGHRADFSLMLMDPNPLTIDSIHQQLLASGLGPAIRPTYSYTSISEVSEYVMSVDQYRAKLIREGEAPDSPTLAAKVTGYEKRLPIMNQERLTPEFPEWPVSCFYPMNKSRVPGANWYALPFSKRSALMSEHARSGMKYMGKVKQLITVGVGIDDWEWGVTLWASNPEHLLDIVYTMRFDEASTEYAEFGSFYTTYHMSPGDLLRHCRVL